jgi:ATP-dependent DNA helicase RecG
VWDNITNVLEKLGLSHNGQLLNASILFFARKPTLQLRCAVFASTDTATIIDRHDFTGDILDLIEEAQKYILKNIHIGMRLDGLYRVDVPEISVAAMREAIINAFCHRDYRDPDYVQVAIFKDRVEIRNPGGLYGGLTIKKIRKGNVSKRRNPLVADLLRRIQMVETWGRGMRLILNEEPTVQFSEIAQIFIAAFNRPSFVGSGKGETERTGAATVGIDGTPTKETPKKHQRNTKETILAALRGRPEISVKELAAQLEQTTASIRHHMRMLQKAGVVRHVGSTKAGHWEVMK